MKSQFPASGQPRNWDRVPPLPSKKSDMNLDFQKNFFCNIEAYKALQEETWPNNFEDYFDKKPYLDPTAPKPALRLKKRDYVYYTKLTEKIKNEGYNKLSKLQKSRYADLKSKMEAIEKEYQEETRAYCKAHWLRYKDIPPEVYAHVLEKVTSKLRQAQNTVLPSYIQQNILPLDVLEKNFVQTEPSPELLLNVGDAPNIEVLPFDGMTLFPPNFPVSSALEKKVGLGVDMLGAWLASKHEAQAVIPLSLLRFLAGGGLRGDTWELPATVDSCGGFAQLYHPLPHTDLPARKQFHTAYKSWLLHSLTLPHTEEVLFIKEVKRTFAKNQRVTRSLTRRFCIPLEVVKVEEADERSHLPPEVSGLYHNIVNSGKALSYSTLQLGPDVKAVVRASRPPELYGSPLLLEPRLEMQSQLGWEVGLPSEQRLWLLNTLLRPGSPCLLRVHVNPTTSQILKSNTVTHQDLKQSLPAQRLEECHMGLHAVGQLVKILLSFGPGQYLVTHRAGHQFIYVYSHPSPSFHYPRLLLNTAELLASRLSAAGSSLLFAREAPSFETRPLDFLASLPHMLTPPFSSARARRYKDSQESQGPFAY